VRSECDSPVFRKEERDFFVSNIIQVTAVATMKLKLER